MAELDVKAKKTALRLVNTGLYILGLDDGGEWSASTVSWYTQTSFDPVLFVLGVKKDSSTFELVKKTKKFALSILKSGQKDEAYAFFKHAEQDGTKLNGQEFEAGPETGSPILVAAPAWIEAKVLNIIEEPGDHAVVLAEVIQAGVKDSEVTAITTGELGVHYGG